MINKLYDKFKIYIKQNFISLIIIVVLFLFFTIKLPYYISSPGGLLNTADKVTTDSSFKLKGSLNMAYVSEAQATPALFLYASINPKWDISKEEEVTTGSEDISDVEYRNKLLLEEANSLALLVAYSHSDISYKIKNNKVYVTYVDDEAKTDLQVKDQIIKMDGKKITQKQDLYDYIKRKNIDDKITFTVIRNNKQKQVKATLIDVNGEAKVGVIATETMDIKSNHQVSLKFKESESGSSGGMMIALTIYSYLNEIDLTNGKTIVGTGTIDKDGNVGSISGVKYKLLGAAKKSADIFLVPAGKNYKTAKKLKEKYNYDIKIVPVKTFDDALNYLKKLD